VCSISNHNGELGAGVGGEVKMRGYAGLEDVVSITRVYEHRDGLTADPSLKFKCLGGELAGDSLRRKLEVSVSLFRWNWLIQRVGFGLWIRLIL